MAALVLVSVGGAASPAPAAKAKPAAPAVSTPGLAEADVNAALQAAYEKYRTLQEGKNAD